MRNRASFYSENSACEQASPKRVCPSIRAFELFVRFVAVLVLAEAASTWLPAQSGGNMSGIVIYTTLDNGRDETAIALPFVKAEQFPLVTNVVSQDGRSIRVTNNMLKQIVRPTDLSRATVVDQSGLQALKSETQAIWSLQQRYPQARGALEGIAGAMERAVQLIESGNVLLEGRLHSRADYETKVAGAIPRSIDITINGRLYTGARLRSVAEGKVSISHDGGALSIPIAQLSSELVAQLNQTSDKTRIVPDTPTTSVNSPATRQEPPMQITAAPRETITQSLPSETLDVAATSSSVPAVSKTTIDESLRDLASRSFEPLRQRVIKSVAMTYVFHNGSQETPFSNFIKRKITTQLLIEAGSDINLIDRQDFKLQHAEQSFTFTFTPNGTGPTAPEPVDAIFVGELITSPTVGEFLFHLRAIDLKTSRLLSAPSVIVPIDTAMAERLGISELDLPSLPPLPNLTSDLNTATRSLAAGFDPKQIFTCLEDPGSFAEGDNLLKRLTRTHLTSTLVQDGWRILERELFFLVDRDQSATGAASEGYLAGDVVISLVSDDSAPPTSPTFFVKAIQVKDGRLVGQSEISFGRLAAKLASEVLGNGTAGVSMGGADQSLADALRRTQGKSGVAKGDPLVFTASAVLGETLKPKPETLDRIRKGYLSHESSETTPPLFHLQKTQLDTFKWWFSADKDDAESRKGFAKLQMVEESLFRLNAIESGDIEAVKADLIAFLFWGYGIEYRNGPSVSNHVHIGPLLDIAAEIYTTYSLYPDGRSSVREWLRIFSIAEWGDFGPGSFSSRLLMSVNPRFRPRLSGQFETAPLHFPRGSYRFNSSEFSPLADGEDIAKNIAFDYSLEAVWKEAFPSTLKATIDLTPMKENLYKLRK